jgi:hypothetical protein
MAEGNTSKGVAIGILISLAVAVVAGIIVVNYEHGVFPTSSGARVAGSTEQQQVESTPETPADEPIEEQPAAPQVPEVSVPVTPAVDDKTFIEYRIEVVGKKLSATEYSSSSVPGYYMKVFTAAGEVGYREGCYAHMELYNNGSLLTTGDMDCGLAGGWSTNWWPNDTKLDEGTVRVTASITSDWGATAFTETTFTVRKP